MIVIWRFTGRRTISEHSEHTAQRLVAGTFLLLIPFFLYEAIRRLIDGSDTTSSALGIAVTTSAIVLMPALGRAKLRLGQRLGSSATAGEGIQNLMCALQATVAHQQPVPRCPTRLLLTPKQGVRTGLARCRHRCQF